MLTGPLVLLTTRKWWTSVGPRGTEPKSLDSSSNIESAQVAEKAGLVAQSRPAPRTRQYRDMVHVSLLQTPGPARCYAPRQERVRTESISIFLHGGAGVKVHVGETSTSTG